MDRDLILNIIKFILLAVIICSICIIVFHYLYTNCLRKCFKSQSAPPIRSNINSNMNHKSINRTKNIKKELRGSSQNYTLVYTSSESDLTSDETCRESAINLKKRERQSRLNSSPTVIFIRTSEASVQTDDTEKHIAVQADIVPKILNPRTYVHQQVQTEICFPSDQDIDLFHRLDSDSSIFTESEPPSIPMVINLPNVSQQQIYRFECSDFQENNIGHLEERIYRISRWFEDSEKNELSESSNDKLSQEPLLSNSGMESFMARLKEDVRILPIHRPSNNEPLIEWDRADDRANIFTPTKDFASGSGALKQNKIEITNSSPIRNSNLRTWRELKQIYSPQTKPKMTEPVKVKRRLSDYLKGQYRSIEDDTIGKSLTMMQDLKQVLRKREEAKV